MYAYKEVAPNYNAIVEASGVTGPLQTNERIRNVEKWIATSQAGSLPDGAVVINTIVGVEITTLCITISKSMK